MPTDRADMLSKIQKLIALSQNNPFSEEAALAMAKADELMQQYRIETWELQYEGDHRQLDEPVLKWIKLDDRPKFFEVQLRLAGDCFMHAECLYVYRSHTREVGVVGYPADVMYGEMLYTHLLTYMMTHLAPQFNPSESFEENLVRFKEAGMKWQDIHRHVQPGVPWERRHGVRYTSIYTKYCKEHGRHRTYASPEQYFDGFSKGFVDQVYDRFWQLRTRMDRQGGIVLKDRKEKLREAYYGFFPHLRPKPSVPGSGPSVKLAKYKVPKPRRIAGDAYRAGNAAAANADLIDRSGEAPRHLEG